MAGTPNQMPLIMKAIVKHDLEAFTNLYKGKEDLLLSYTINSSYYSIVSLICHLDSHKVFKNILIQILNEAISNNISIESPSGDDIYQEGVCHWICTYRDIDVAKLMLNTPNVLINRLDKAYKTGPTLLSEVRDRSLVVELIKLLIEKGFDINTQKNEDVPTLLESFISSISINYDAVEFLINQGARTDAKHSKRINTAGEHFTLIEVVNQGKNEKLKQIFQVGLNE